MLKHILALAALVLFALPQTAGEEDLGELKNFELSDLTQAKFQSTSELLGQAILIENFAHW